MHQSSKELFLLKLTRFGQVNGYNRNHQLNTAKRSSWSNMQRRSLRLVKAAKFARARKTSTQATQGRVADDELVKRIDRLMGMLLFKTLPGRSIQFILFCLAANLRQEFLTFAMHLKGQEFTASLNCQVEVEQVRRRSCVWNTQILICLWATSNIDTTVYQLWYIVRRILMWLF